MFLFKPSFHVLTPLQLQVVELGRCPFCHEKTLEWVPIKVVSVWEVLTCGKCKRIYLTGDKGEL
jgi:uncharacterized protein YbaR (Trm112 family)